MNVAIIQQLEGLFVSASKIGILIFLLIYILFSFMVSRQVALMTKTLEIGLEGLIKKVAFLHFLFSIFAFFLALFIL